MYSLVSFSERFDQPASWFTWNDIGREYASTVAPVWVFQHLNNHPWTFNHDPSSIYPDLTPFGPPVPTHSPIDSESSDDLDGNGNPGGSDDSDGNGNPDGSDDSDGNGNSDGGDDSDGNGNPDGSDYWDEDLDARTDSYIGSPSGSPGSASLTAFSPSTSSISFSPERTLNRYNSVRQRTIYRDAERYMTHLGMCASFQSAIRAVCRALQDDRRLLSDSLSPFFENIPHGEEEIDIFLDHYLQGFRTD
jgi:hypothetical protein